MAETILETIARIEEEHERRGRALQQIKTMLNQTKYEVGKEVILHVVETGLEGKRNV